MRPPRRLTAKKLLVASLGVAAISYLGCGSSQREDPPVSGNLMPPPPPPMDAGAAQPETIRTQGADQPTPQPSAAATPQPSAAVTPQPSASAKAQPTPKGSAAVPKLPLKPPVAGNLMAPRQ